MAPSSQRMNIYN